MTRVERAKTSTVMPGLEPGIHVSSFARNDVDGRDKSGHDEASEFAS
ncbi:hypothetical protein [Bradyrhizobium sp. ORS 375]|nr:hypothetical protein [Bradyrhizobium sp. ORS 375]